MAASSTTQAFLSVRLPEATRDRLKRIAAARGETVQALVGNLVARFLVEEDRHAPFLGSVLGQLRAQRPMLERRGVTGLWVFGSVARGDATAESDIDLLVEFDSHAPVSLVGLASLRAELSDRLDAAVDLVERSALSQAARHSADREAVRVF